jgi:hypothetical protein
LFGIVRCEARDFPLLLCLHVADLKRERMEQVQVQVQVQVLDSDGGNKCVSDDYPRASNAN